MIRVLVEIRGGVAYIKAATEEVDIIVLDYDDLEVGEPLCINQETPEIIWPSEKIDQYIDEELNNHIYGQEDIYE